MPTISTFYGIMIRMFYGDHAPPQFHALSAEHEALIEISSLSVIGGDLPCRALHLTLKWARSHRAELLEDWELCRAMRLPKPIPPA